MYNALTILGRVFVIHNTNEDRDYKITAFVDNLMRLKWAVFKEEDDSFVTYWDYCPVERIQHNTLVEELDQICFTGSLGVHINVTGILKRISDQKIYSITGVDGFDFVTDDGEYISQFDVDQYQITSASNENVMMIESFHQTTATWSLYNFEGGDNIPCRNRNERCFAVMCKIDYNVGDIVTVNKDFLSLSNTVEFRSYVSPDKLAKIDQITDRLLYAKQSYTFDNEMRVTSITGEDFVVPMFVLRKARNCDLDIEYGEHVAKTCAGTVVESCYNGDTNKYILRAWFEEGSSTKKYALLDVYHSNKDENNIVHGYQVTEDYKVVGSRILRRDFKLVTIDIEDRIAHRKRFERAKAVFDIKQSTCTFNHLTVGDTVEIKTTERMCEEYGMTNEGDPNTITRYTDAMEKFVSSNEGRKITVRWVSDDGIRFTADNCDFMFSIDMDANGGYEKTSVSVTNKFNLTDEQKRIPDSNSEYIPDNRINMMVVRCSFANTMFFSVETDTSIKKIRFARYINQNTGEVRQFIFNNYSIANFVDAIEEWIGDIVTEIVVVTDRGSTQTIYERGVSNMGSSINNKWITAKCEVDNALEESVESSDHWDWEDDGICF